MEWWREWVVWMGWLVWPEWGGQGESGEVSPGGGLVGWLLVRWVRWYGPVLLPL